MLCGGMYHSIKKFGGFMFPDTITLQMMTILGLNKNKCYQTNSYKNCKLSS